MIILLCLLAHILIGVTIRLLIVYLDPFETELDKKRDLPTLLYISFWPLAFLFLLLMILDKLEYAVNKKGLERKEKRK